MNEGTAGSTMLNSASNKLVRHADNKRNADFTPARQSSPRLSTPRLSAQQALDEVRRNRASTDTRVDKRSADHYLLMSVPLLAVVVIVLLFVYLLT